MSALEFEKGLQRLRQGGMVILVDDEDRENEGDLVLAAEHATAENINFMVREARGLVCLSLTAERVEELGLLPMVPENQSTRQTAFTVSIEARFGVTTGISAADRAHTIRVAMDARTHSHDLIRPGHIFPLRAQPGGVLVRAGHTEGSVDLMKIAGLAPGAVICEVMNDDGTMARLPDLRVFSQKHDIPILSIREVIGRRLESEHLVERVSEAKLPTRLGKNPLQIVCYRSVIDGTEHLALVAGQTTETRPRAPTLVRVHSECLTGDALGSLRCDCGQQLQAAIDQISESGNGVLVYMRNHEGRGIGLANKVRAYALQDQGMDTVEANRHLGFQPDLRHYGLGAQILRDLGVRQIRLLTNNPKKVVGLEGYGLEIVERVGLQMPATAYNQAYLTTKREKLGHTLTNLSHEGGVQ